ncbi:MAG: sigma-70 family RNA polymerase sigma factor [Bacteroidota bacterium]|nr:sigma-70 family RNA polymerase sigma factor [Bacteroidota bacterium]
MTQEQAISLYHPMLQGIAYKILRSKADAEDIVQDTFLRWLCIDHEKIQNTKAYLINAVINNCLNHVKKLQRKKEEYLENFNFQDIIGRFTESEIFNFDLQTEVSEAFLILHAKLEPLERAVYLLKEVFDFDYDTLQEVLDKNKDHCRQLFSRARKKLHQETDKINFSLPSLPNKTELINSFLNAIDIGNPSELVAQLKKDIGKAICKSF